MEVMMNNWMVRLILLLLQQRVEKTRGNGTDVKHESLAEFELNRWLFPASVYALTPDISI